MDKARRSHETQVKNAAGEGSRAMAVTSAVLCSPFLGASPILQIILSCQSLPSFACMPGNSPGDASPLMLHCQEVPDSNEQSSAAALRVDAALAST